MIKHTIMMIARDDDIEMTYNDVVSYMGLYGCQIRLEFEDGSTATFDNRNWLMFDLTPTRGWNCNATEIKSK